MVDAPALSRFPRYPQSWYLFCESEGLRNGPLSKHILGRRLVAYRTASKRVIVMEARCSHLGADLGRGEVVGESIRCPFHHWEYGPDGHCTRVPTTKDVPAFARQACYPAVERHGYVFFFNGRRPLFPLPFFFDARPEDFVAGRAFRFIAECAWFLLTANGFDAEHFQAVHDRKLLAPPRVDCPAPFARRMHYIAQVTGDSIYDLLIRLLLGDRVEVSITTWGGPLILVTGFFRRVRSYILIATQPLNENQTLSEVIVLAPRLGSASGQALLQPLSLRLRRWFTRGFMQDDIDRLGGIRYNPHTLIDADRLLIEYFHWAAALPHGSEDRPRLLDPAAAANGEDGAHPFQAVPQVPECRHVESPS